MKLQPTQAAGKHDLLQRGHNTWLVQRNWLPLEREAYSEKSESANMFEEIDWLLRRLDRELKQVLGILLAERWRRVQ